MGGNLTSRNEFHAASNDCTVEQYSSSFCLNPIFCLATKIHDQSDQRISMSKSFETLLSTVVAIIALAAASIISGISTIDGNFANFGYREPCARDLGILWLLVYQQKVRNVSLMKKKKVIKFGSLSIQLHYSTRNQVCPHPLSATWGSDTNGSQRSQPEFTVVKIRNEQWIQ